MVDTVDTAVPHATRRLPVEGGLRTRRDLHLPDARALVDAKRFAGCEDYDQGKPGR